MNVPDVVVTSFRLKYFLKWTLNLLLITINLSFCCEGRCYEIYYAPRPRPSCMHKLALIKVVVLCSKMAC